jgi:hypothetical protein
LTVRYIALFIFIQAIAFVLLLAGLPIVAILALFKLWTNDNPPQWQGGFITWLFSNEIDGVFGPNNPRTRWQAFYWSALRNPVNNFRFVPGVSGVDRPFVKYIFGNYYFQAGWNDSGYPVLSAGSGQGT